MVASIPGQSSAAVTAAMASWMRRLGAILNCPATADAVLDSGRMTAPACLAMTRLAEQAVHMGIDYATLGLHWNHPIARIQYRQGKHQSIMAPASRQRAERSRSRLESALLSISRGELDCQTAVRTAVVLEIGLQMDGRVARMSSFDGCSAAMEAELLLPLRAYNEAQRCMHRTHAGEPVPADKIAEVVESITMATLSRPGGFADWRYGNPVGQEQLRGLTSLQTALWRVATSMQHKSGLRTHEDAEGELGFFWATKIGGPSHGFDFEAQCHLPLLANARHKVVLLSDPEWRHGPAGRAHFRLLWSAGLEGNPATILEPRLWLEAVNICFSAVDTVHQENFVPAFLRHAIAKADAMEVPLLVDPRLTQVLLAVAQDFGSGGAVGQIHERLVLRPTNGVCEASDYLSNRHDWVQLQEEVTEPLLRALYVPTGYVPAAHALQGKAGSEKSTTSPTNVSVPSPTTNASAISPTTGRFTWSTASAIPQ